MGNQYEDDFGEDLIGILEKEYPDLAKEIENDNLRLAWGDSVDVVSRWGRVGVYKYISKESSETEYIGTINFKVRLSFDGFGQWEPDGIVENSISFNSKNE